ncbi:unnamed protein product [Coregonus sp. 'balchen']|nr:unnamed protein product [Coregonus sp. 'balchen']
MNTVYTPTTNMDIKLKLLTVQQTLTSLGALQRNQRLRGSAVIRRHLPANKSATMRDSSLGTRLGRSTPKSSPFRGRSITPGIQFSSTIPLPPSPPLKSSSSCNLTPPQSTPSNTLVVQQRIKRDGALSKTVKDG